MTDFKIKERKLYFTKQVTQESIAELCKSLLDIQAADDLVTKLIPTYTPDPIQLYIDSYGGSVYQCLAVLGVMENMKTPVHTYVMGVAMSTGFMIAVHGKKRFAFKHSTYMYHQIASAAWGKLADMKDDLAETERLHKILVEMTIKQTKIPLKTIEDNYERKKDWFMDVNEAKNLGCVDEIL